LKLFTAELGWLIVSAIVVLIVFLPENSTLRIFGGVGANSGAGEMN
jgi:hypothetical protein